MVSEWEREELGRLTLRNLKAVQEQQADSSPLTHQNLRELKDAQIKTDTHEVRVKLFFERLKMSASTGLTSLFSTGGNRKRKELCETYGHNWPAGQSWEGVFPKCLDCGKEITDSSQLRTSVPIKDRGRHLANPGD